MLAKNGFILEYFTCFEFHGALSKKLRKLNKLIRHIKMYTISKNKNSQETVIE